MSDGIAIDMWFTDVSDVIAIENRAAKSSDQAEDLPLLGSCFLNIPPFRFILKFFVFSELYFTASLLDICVSLMIWSAQRSRGRTLGRRHDEGGVEARMSTLLVIAKNIDRHNRSVVI